MYCTGQKEWRKVLTVQAIYSTLGVERIVESFLTHEESNEAYNTDYISLLFGPRY